MKNINKIRVFLWLLMIFILSIVISCSDSQNNNQVKDKEQESFLQIEETKNQLIQKYNAVYFPPDSIDASSFTFEIQNFFKKQSNKLFAFEGFLEDIEQENDKIIIEFLCPIGKYSVIDIEFIRFRLSITNDQIKQFHSKNIDDFTMSFLHYLDTPDYLIIASIDDVIKSRIYTFNGYNNDEGIIIDVDKSKRIVSIGTFIDVVPNN